MELANIEQKYIRTIGRANLTDHFFQHLNKTKQYAKEFNALIYDLRISTYVLYMVIEIELNDFILWCGPLKSIHLFFKIMTKES